MVKSADRNPIGAGFVAVADGGGRHRPTIASRLPRPRAVSFDGPSRACLLNGPCLCFNRIKDRLQATLGLRVHGIEDRLGVLERVFRASVGGYRLDRKSTR